MRRSLHEKNELNISDEKIVELYWQRDESAITYTDRKYRSYLLTVAYNIVHDKLDCEECLNDTYLGAWEAMPPSKPNVLKAFLSTIMRRVAVNRYHANTRKKAVPSEMLVSLSELEGVIFSSDSLQEELDFKHLGEVISDFVRSLGKRQRHVFMSRYFFAEPIDSIARELSVSRSTVNKELAVIRRFLAQKLESEGYAL